MLNVALTDVKKIILGAQNCHFEDSGAYTGETSCEFLKEINCQFVIVGHSERRHIFNEDDETLKKKVLKVLDKDLLPIYCVGETLDEREANQTIDVIKRQLETAVKGLHPETAAKVVVAYEPVWAIGTGKTATPNQAQEIHNFIRDWFCDEFGLAVSNNLRILYGGSVKPDNIRNLMEQKDVDGALVGGASLKSEDFFDIILGAEN